MEKSDEINKNLTTAISQISNMNELYENFLCHICKGWPMKPLLCQTCDKYFCLSCAKDNNENKLSLICTNCPKDIKSMINSPPKTILNFLSKSNFDCLFCKKNFKYDDIVKHALYCEDNPGRKVVCNKCRNEVGKDRLETHDCVEELLAEIKRTKEKLEEYDKTTPFNFTEYNKLKYTLNFHNHPLPKIKMRNGWLCDMYCKERFSSGTYCYFCYDCNYGFCERCFLYTFNRKENTCIHEHPLKATMCRNAWKCKICNIEKEGISTTNWTCELCPDVQICLKCYYV